jgi:hypothetical protein
MANSTDLRDRIWVGPVVDNNDPEKLGRCRIKVFSLFDDLEDSAVPWAFPVSNGMFAGGPGGMGSISIPKIGTIVRVSFSEGNLYSPEFYGIQTINRKMQADISDTYLGSHVIAYDEDEEMKILYTPGVGLKLFHKDSHITINPDSSITIEHKDSQSIIELVGTSINITANSTINITSNSLIKSESSEVAMNGTSVTKLGPAPTYSAVLAEPLWQFLQMLAANVDSKLPSTPGAMAGAASSFQQLSTSKNVKLSQ